MINYIVRDTRNNHFKIKGNRGWKEKNWTPFKEKAALFRTKGAATISCYCYSINPDRCKLGAKIILPDWISIEEVTINL